MKQASLIIGIIVIIGMVIGFIPCLGWFNWLNLPLAVVGIVLGAIAYKDERNLPMQYEYDPMIQRKNDLPIGLILCGIAFIFGLFRLFIGGGIF
jgi:hypothetical protein